LNISSPSERVLLREIYGCLFDDNRTQI